MRNIISKKIPKDVTVMYNYGAGVLCGNCFCLNNVKDFTGFEIYETGKDGEVPGVAVRIANNIRMIKENSEKEIVLAKKENKIINLMPFMKSDCLREIEKEAGCTFYTDRAGNTVYGDNRFIGIFSPDGKSGEIKELL
ncbi:MAG: hypothetical protein IJB70_10640 [Clostridia bacterium]|nr:hypothetical protein [Clostridia bacterium]